MIFKFRMLSDEVDDFLRDYEVPYDMPLSDFRTFVRESLGYSATEMASIFRSDAEWEKLEEYTSVDMGSPEETDIDPGDDIQPPRYMGDVVLGQVIREKFDRLIYVFDLLAERQFYLELLEAKFCEEGVQYPRVTAAAGNPPPQQRSNELDDELSLFDEAMDEFDAFEGDEGYDDE